MFNKLRKLIGGDDKDMPKAPPEQKLATIVELEEPIDEFADDQNIQAD